MSAAGLAVTTLLGVVSPWLLLLFIAVLGVGERLTSRLGRQSSPSWFPGPSLPRR